jgi:NitT/TauT family transport system substrate-binding protein
MRRIIVAGIATAGLLLLGGCTSPAATPQQQQQRQQQRHGAGSPVGPPGTQASGELRLGLTENLTDAPALLGWQLGFYGQNLGKVTLQPAPFTSAAAEITALREGQLDAAYLDPIAALQAWQADPGLIKIIAGAAAGGAELVVAPHITSPAQLKGRTLAAPADGAQLAAADTWLRQHGLPALTAAEASTSADAGLLQQFRSGKIAGAWEPPPLDAQLTAAGGRVLVNEATLWPGGKFPTSVLVVTKHYLTADPLAVTALLKGQAQADRFLTTSQVSARAALAQRLTAVGSVLPAAIIASSFAQLTFTSDPLTATLLTEAQHAAAAGLIKPVTNLTSIYDLGPLNQVLKAVGQRPVGA